MHVVALLMLGFLYQPNRQRGTIVLLIFELGAIVARLSQLRFGQAQPGAISSFMEIIEFSSIGRRPIFKRLGMYLWRDVACDSRFWGDDGVDGRV